MLHITKSTLSNYENDRRLPDLDFIKSFSELLDVSADYLIGLTQIPQGHAVFKKKVGKNSTLEQIVNVILSLDAKHGETLIEQMYYIAFHNKVYAKQKKMFVDFSNI